MKATVKFWPNAAENPERVTTKEDTICGEAGVNENVAVTEAPATLELSVTCKSKSEDVIRDTNPKLVLSVATRPEDDSPLKVAETTFDNG